MELVKLKLYRVEKTEVEVDGKFKKETIFQEVDDGVASLDGDENESNSFWAEILYGILGKKASVTSKSGSQERVFNKNDEDHGYIQDLIQEAMITSSKQDGAMAEIVNMYCKSTASKDCMFMVATVVDNNQIPHLIATELNYIEGVMTIEEEMSGSNRVLNGTYSSFFSYPLILEGNPVSSRCKVKDNKWGVMQNIFSLSDFMDYEEECERSLRKALESYVIPENQDFDDAFSNPSNKARRERPLVKQHSILSENDWPVYEGSSRLEGFDARHIVDMQAVDLADLGMDPPKVSVKDLSGTTVKLDPSGVGSYYTLVADEKHGNFLVVRLEYEKIKGPLTVLDFSESMNVDECSKWMLGKKPIPIEVEDKKGIEYLDLSAPIG